MGHFSIEELRIIAKNLFSKAVSAVDPYHRLKEILTLEKDRLYVAVSEDAVTRIQSEGFRSDLPGWRGKGLGSHGPGD